MHGNSLTQQQNNDTLKCCVRFILLYVCMCHRLIETSNKYYNLLYARSQSEPSSWSLLQKTLLTQAARLAQKLTHANKLAPSVPGRHTAEIEDLALDHRFANNNTTSCLNGTDTCVYLRFNTFGGVLAVKSRLRGAALTFEVVKRFCWLTVPPCYSFSDCKPMLSVYLAGSCCPPPQQTTSRGSSSSICSVTASSSAALTAMYLYGRQRTV